jgi:hypothetical protein
MNPKVVKLVALVEDGFAIRGARPRRDGGIRLRVGRGRRVEVFDFAFYEVPAIHHATRFVGVAQ